MRQAGVTGLILILALFQVSVVSMFPVGAAVPDTMLVTLMLLAVFRGPVTGLWAIPLAAAVVGLGSNRSPGLLLIAYLPMLPLAHYLESAGAPLNRYAQTAITATATGMWARSILMLSTVLQGAHLEAGTFVFRLLLPGVLFDVALLSLAYLGFRLLGWEPRSTNLQRSSFFR